MTDRDGLGELIRKTRRRRGWTQKQLAEAIGASGSYISQIETGARKWPQELIPDLSKALRIEEVDMAVAAGLISQRDNRPATPPEDPVRAELVEKLTRVQLTPDRVEGLEAILDRWLRRDRTTRERIEEQGARAHAEAQHG